MPFLESQITIINRHLKANALSDKRFSQGLIVGLAQQTTRSEDGDSDQVFPTYYNLDTPTYIGIDDTYPLIIYHRLIGGNSYSSPEGDSFGDGNNSIEQTSTMAMIVFGKRSALRMSAEQLETICILAAPTQILQSELIGTPMDSMSVEVTGSDMDPFAVFGEEYQGVDYRISPENILLKITYIITAQYRKDCIDLCDCLPQ